jgi:hypothetical protein
MSQVNNPTGLPRRRPAPWSKDWSVANYLHELEEFTRQVYDNLTGITRIRSYTVANLPDAADFNPEDGGAAFIFVSNASGGAVTAFSDGLVWRRTTDRTVVS